jgi:thiamine pyrophosphate-dependent acetolactate synthase large subunit-like protein
MTDARAHGSIARRPFVAALLKACPDALVVAGLGSPAYDAFAAGDRDGNFYLWGAMGGAAAMGLGLALAQPSRSVLVLTGDGEQLMGIGALATIGVQKPKNLAIVVLDNGHFGETGMQASHTGHGVSLVKMALACGLDWAEDVTSDDAIATLARRINAREGCGLAQVRVRAEELPRALPTRDGVHLKNRFRATLGLEPV